MLNRIRCPAFSRVFPKNRCERAASGISPGTKIFLQKRLLHKGYPPLWDRTIFGQVFVRGGMIKFSKRKVPPTGGWASAPQQAAGSCSLLRDTTASCQPRPLTDELDHVEKPALGRWSCRRCSACRHRRSTSQGELPAPSRLVSQRLDLTVK